METFKPSKATVYKNGKKWYIRYTMKFPDKTEYRKEFGKDYGFNPPINKLTDVALKEQQINVLQALVQKDLDNGIDPVSRSAKVQAVILEKANAAKAYKYDEAVEDYLNYKGYINAVDNKSLSAVNLKSFFRTSFRREIERIGKLDDIRTITKKDIEGIIERHFNPADDKVREWSSTTSRGRLDWMGSLFSYCVQEKDLAVSPIKGIKIKKDNQKKRYIAPKKEVLARFQVFTETEVNTLFNHLESNDLKYNAILKTIYYAYIRRSEIFRLRLWMVDLENNKFQIPSNISKNGRHAKSYKISEVIIPAELSQALKLWIDSYFSNTDDPDDFLFPKSGFKDIQHSFGIFHYTFNKIVEGLQVENPSLFIGKKPYGLKHTGITRFIQKNRGNTKISPSQLFDYIKKQCRHASFTETEKYLRDDLGIDLNVGAGEFIY